MKWRELSQTRTLAFSISVRHAIFIADYFRKQGVKAQAVYAGSDTPRNKALSDLQAGKLDIIFSVDLFNEGTDIPSIDTLLMLRATESRKIGRASCRERVESSVVDVAIKKKEE